MFLCLCRIFIQTLMDQSCAYWHFVLQSTNSRRTKKPVQGQQTHLPSHKTCWLSSGEFLQGLHQLDSWEESIKKALLKVYKSCKVDRCHFHDKRKGILRQVSKYKHADWKPSTQPTYYFFYNALTTNFIETRPPNQNSYEHLVIRFHQSCLPYISMPLSFSKLWLPLCSQFIQRGCLLFFKFTFASGIFTCAGV